MKNKRCKTLSPIMFLSGIISTQALAQAPADSVPTGSSYGTLDEIVVVKDRPVIKSDGATTVYDIDQDVTAKGSSIIDILRKVPSVTVDGQDNIRVNGQNDFKIYIDGHEDPTLSANASQILKVMPAETISRIEIITEPGAKFDAEGTGGIINLITSRKQSSDGYSGNLTMMMSTRQQAFSAYGRLKHDKVTASLNATFAGSLLIPMKVNSSSSQVNFNNPGETFVYQEHQQENKFNYNDVGLNLSWEPDSKNLFTTSLKFMSVYGTIDNSSAFSYSLDNKGDLNWSVRRIISGFMKNLSANAKASYQHTFAHPRHQLVVSWLFDFGRNPLTIGTEYTESEKFDIPYRFTTNRTYLFNREHTVQIDYINPLNSDRHLIETGIKALIRRNTSFGHTCSGSEATDQPVLSDITDMGQHQDIAAGYASYSGTFSALTAKAGIRYEHTRLGIRNHHDSRHDFTTRLNDIVPNAALTWSFSPMNSLRLSYQMRISRPTINQVNPYRMSLEINSVQSGNPDLGSERNNKVALTYSAFGRVLGGNISIEYSNTGNMISEYSYYADGIIYKTFSNIGRRQATAMSGFINWQIIPRMNLGLNGRVEYINLDSRYHNISNCGWSGNWGANFDYTLPCRIRLNAYGGQGIHNISVQGYSSGWYYYGIGVSRSFLKDDSLTIGLTANNFMTARTFFHSYTATPEYRLHERHAVSNWDTGVNISWKFGSLKSDVKKTAADIDNSDSSSAGSDNKRIGRL